MIEPCKANVIYLDNNGTTKLCADSKHMMVKWLDSRSNPSADSIIAKKATDLLNQSKKYIAEHCGVDNYTVLFTSGASESNCLILRSVAEAYKLHKKTMPNIIVSSTEHKSIIDCCKQLHMTGLASITVIPPLPNGCIDPSDVAKAIKPNTALISIIAANNEIGCINDISAIADIAHSKHIPFHTDGVQIFGKYKLPMDKIDALSVSFHKLYGPVGVGLMIVNNLLIEGYGLSSQIAGTQQKALRGGTENVPAIAGAVASIKHVFTGRDKKNKKLMNLKNKIVKGIEKKYPLGDFANYVNNIIPKRNEFLILGPKCNGDYNKPNSLPNTLLVSFIKNVRDKKSKSKSNTSDQLKPFCNIDLKRKLNEKNIIVSIGSACSTSSPSASHVLTAIKAPQIVKQGVVRISLSDDTTSKEIDIFLEELLKAVADQMHS